MEPIEINAGSWYLRALRADGRIDDRPALAEGGVTDPEHVGRRNADWETEIRYSWAVCEPTTAELVAEIVLTPGEDGSAEITGWARAGQDPALDAARAAVSRFAVGALGLRLN